MGTGIGRRGGGRTGTGGTTGMGGWGQGHDKHKIGLLEAFWWLVVVSK